MQRPNSMHSLRLTSLVESNKVKLVTLHITNLSQNRSEKQRCPE